MNQLVRWLKALTRREPPRHIHVKRHRHVWDKAMRAQRDYEAPMPQYENKERH